MRWIDTYMVVDQRAVLHLFLTTGDMNPFGAMLHRENIYIAETAFISPLSPHIDLGSFPYLPAIKGPSGPCARHEHSHFLSAPGQKHVQAYRPGRGRDAESARTKLV